MFKIKAQYENDIIQKDFIKFLNEVKVLNNVAFTDNFTLVGDIQEDDLEVASFILKAFIFATDDYSPKGAILLNGDMKEINKVNIDDIL